MGPFPAYRSELPIQQGWREAFLISGSYGMGDPMATSDSEGNSEGGGTARRIASRQAKRAGITRPQLLEMSRPEALGT